MRALMYLCHGVCFGREVSGRRSHQQKKKLGVNCGTVRLGSPNNIVSKEIITGEKIKTFHFHVKCDVKLATLHRSDRSEEKNDFFFS